MAPSQEVIPKEGPAIPITFVHLDDQRGILYTASGLVTGAELRAAVMRANQREFGASPVLYSFFDFSAAASLEITAGDLWDIAAVAVEAAAKSLVKRSIAVCVKDDSSFGLARMLKSQGDRTAWETEIFRDKGEAIAWLKHRVEERFGLAVELA